MPEIQRGEEYDGHPGSKYVGTDARSSVIWVWYRSSSGTFESMCLVFDRLQIIAKRRKETALS